MGVLQVSVIIPTLNRKPDLEKTLISISKCGNLPLEIIIVDQSDNDDIKHFCQKFKKINIRYLYTNLKSSALARNLGIDILSKNSDVILFLDDDVLLEKDFFLELEKFFLDNGNAKGGTANIDNIVRKVTLLKRIGLFLLSGKWKQNKFFVTRGGFNVMPFVNSVNKEIVEWTPGCGMFFRKSVFDEGFRFEKNFLKYSLMEDCFLSYGIQEKYPNSLFFVPSIKMTHCESPVSRIANKQKIYQNIIHRFYFVKKFDKSILAYIWTIFIFSISDFIQYRTFKVFYRYFKGLKYLFENKNNIGDEEFNFNNFIFGKQND